jgi:hypothetical protein
MKIHRNRETRVQFKGVPTVNQHIFPPSVFRWKFRLRILRWRKYFPWIGILLLGLLSGWLLERRRGRRSWLAQTMFEASLEEGPIDEDPFPKAELIQEDGALVLEKLRTSIEPPIFDEQEMLEELQTADGFPIFVEPLLGEGTKSYAEPPLEEMFPEEEMPVTAEQPLGRDLAGTESLSFDFTVPAEAVDPYTSVPSDLLVESFEPKFQFSWQNPDLLKDIYPFRLPKLVDFLAFFTEIDLVQTYRAKVPDDPQLLDQFHQAAQTLRQTRQEVEARLGQAVAEYSKIDLYFAASPV